MVSNFLINHEEIALVVNYRKLTSSQRDTISFILADMASTQTPRMSLVVDNNVAPLRLAEK